MSESRFVEVLVAAKERRSCKLTQQRNDVLVLHSQVADIDADLAGMNAPASELFVLILGNALVENVQAAVGVGSWASSAPRANWTASAIASRLTPGQLRTTSSQGIPLATSSKTSATNTRVPRKVSWPWQIFGSATTYVPSSLPMESLVICRV